MTRSLRLPVTIRRSTLDDMSGVDHLLARSYPNLLAADYPPSILVLAVPLLVRAQPELLTSGRYFVADHDGRIVGAGGYSWSAPTNRQEGTSRDVAHIRHVATDPDAIRQGIATALLSRIIADAGAAGAKRFDCLSTRTAVPFYRAIGFESTEEVLIGLRAGIDFPAIRMQRNF